MKKVRTTRIKKSTKVQYVRTNMLNISYIAFKITNTTICFNESRIFSKILKTLKEKTKKIFWPYNSQKYANELNFHLIEFPRFCET